MCFCQSEDVFFFPAEAGIRGLVRSRGLGDVYKRQSPRRGDPYMISIGLVYTSDAADDLPCVDLGGRRIIKKKISCILHTQLPYYYH